MRRACRLVLAASALAASVATADVRLGKGHGSLTVETKLRDGDAWTPGGRVDGLTLNPLGTLRGDGAPSLSLTPGSALAVWQVADHLAMAMAAERGAWQDLQPLRTGGATGVPQVARLREGWLVAWTQLRTGDAFTAVITAQGEVAAIQPLGVGDVQALVTSGDWAGAFVTGPGGTVLLAGGMVPDERPPIWRTIVLDERVVPSHARPESGNSTHVLRLPHDRLLVLNTVTGTALIKIADESAAATSTVSIALGGSSIATASLDDASAVAMWWVNPHSLGWVRVSEGQVGEVRHVTSRREFDHGLLREALRAAAQP